MMRKSAILLGLSVALVATAPAHALFGSKKRMAELREEYQPTPYQAPPPVPADGAIFHAAAGYAPLTSGARAAQVGDILTIILVEKTQATKSNSASTDRSGNVRQGMLEASNVNVVEELVDMIETQRAYEVNSKMVQATDEMLRNANQQL